MLLELKKTHLEKAKLDLCREEIKFNHKFEDNPVSVLSFDMAKRVRLVPPFCEQDITKYFAMFEKVAQSLSWPKEYWPVLFAEYIEGYSSCFIKYSMCRL